MKEAGGCLVGILLIVVATLFFMLAGAVVVGTSAAWFLDTPFVDGWDAAWDKAWVLLGFSLIVSVLFGGLKFQSNR
jgi:hypothetical protein